MDRDSEKKKGRGERVWPRERESEKIILLEIERVGEQEKENRKTGIEIKDTQWNREPAC